MLICVCEFVIKGNLIEVIGEKGCEIIKGFCKEMKVSMGCGGCKFMVNDLFWEILKLMGKFVKVYICEYFFYSWRELFDFISVKGIESYD